MCFLVSSSLTVCTSLKVERFLEQLFTDVVKLLCVPDITVTFSLMDF
jgi:hypothetical protein